MLTFSAIESFNVGVDAVISEWTCRTLETSIELFTFAALFISAPLDTDVSWSRGLSSPFYLVGLVAMIQMVWGDIRSSRARPTSSSAILCAAYGWAGANGRRATIGRVSELHRGGLPNHGATELWVVAGATTLVLICVVMLTWLNAASDRPHETSHPANELAITPSS